jgi:hypothetical protein
MMFGDSYKPWHMQMDEYMRRCAEGLPRPERVEVSKSKWIGWGGLKWCSSDNFQHELNREGCQESDPDNSRPRKYADMEFAPAKGKVLGKVYDAWESGQRLMKIGKLNDEEYRLYQRGELKITV